MELDESSCSSAYTNVKFLSSRRHTCQRRKVSQLVAVGANGGRTNERKTVDDGEKREREARL